MRDLMTSKRGSRLPAGFAVLLISCVAVVPNAGPAKAQNVGDAAAGRRLAQAWCANCHVFPGSTQAQTTGAPSFSAIAENQAMTPPALRAFLQTPHNRMPDLHLGNSELDDLIAFVLSSRSR